MLPMLIMLLVLKLTICGFLYLSSAQGFNWYAGTARLARLNGTGTFDAKGLSTSGNIYSGGNTNQVGTFYIGTGGNCGNGRVNITAAGSTKLCVFF